MVLVVNNLDVEVREGTIDGIPLLVLFIRSMAEFEKPEDGTHADR